MSCPAIATTSEIFFYHSFHRHTKHDPNRRTSFSMLRSMLRHGLLLTPEEEHAPRVGGLKQVMWVQHRVCFTALEPHDLVAHQAHFGDFSFEFDGKIVREFGAQPAFYLAGVLSGGALFNASGAGFARHLVEAYSVLDRFWRLQGASHPTLQAAAKMVKAEIFDNHTTDNHPIETLHFTLQALLNLYYPTDQPSVTPLQYFRQREWKIFPNLSHDGKWLYPAPDANHRRALLRMNPHFFGARIGAKQKVDLCMCYAPVDGRHIVREARRLIVPDRFVKRVKNLVASAGVKLPVVPVSSLPPPPALATP